MLKRIGIGVAGSLVVLFVLARFVPFDPVERRPGLTLSGEFSAAPADWSKHVAAREKIWVQTRAPWGLPHSVTTISFTVGGDLYVPCARCSSKRWPRHVASDPNVVVKVGDDLFERRAVRVEDPALLSRVFAGSDFSGGDFSGGDFGANDVWLFRMDAPQD